jgi:hypothetical protein
MKYAHALATTRASAVIAAPGGDGAPCAVIAAPSPMSPWHAPRPAGARRAARSRRPPTGIGGPVGRGRRHRLGRPVRGGRRPGPHRRPHHPPPPRRDRRRRRDRARLRAARARLNSRALHARGARGGAGRRGRWAATASASPPPADGTHVKIPQMAPGRHRGRCGDRGEHDDRPSGRGRDADRAGTKIDNLVQIGHGVVLGRNVLLAAQVGIAGSTTLGDAVMFGGQVGVGGHLTIGDGVKAVGQSGITNSLEAGQFVSGYPAIPTWSGARPRPCSAGFPRLRKRLASWSSGSPSWRRSRVETHDSD